MHQPTTKLHYKPLCNTITMMIMDILITWRPLEAHWLPKIFLQWHSSVHWGLSSRHTGLPLEDHWLRVRVLSCGCKTACAWIRNCQCKNAGLKWINMCSGCGGRTCNNSDLNDDVVWAQPFPVLHARNVSALLDFNSFTEPHIHIQSFTPLPWGGVHHHNP